MRLSVASLSTKSKQLSGASRITFALLPLILCVPVPACMADAPGISSSEIKVGSCSALDGPARQLGLETVLGATAYFDYVNDQGGVNGRKLHLVSHDDGYDAEKAAPCFNQLRKDDVFTAAFFVGTPTAAKYLPLAESEKMPIVGLFTGAPFLYQPVKHYVFGLRASYNDETREQVDNLWKSGIHKIGVIYQDDAFGNVVLEGVKQALAKHNATPAGLGKFMRNTLDVDEGIKEARAAEPEAIVIAAPYAPAAQIVKNAHAAGWRPVFLTVSFVGTEAFIKAAGPDSEGTIITQVVPPYDRTDLPTVKLYRQCISKYMSSTQPSFVSLEGFMDAMVVVDGLKKAGSDLSREKFIHAIESMHDEDFGLGSTGRLMFSSSHHQGFDRVYPTVVHGGKPEMIAEWQAVLKRK